MDTLTIGPPPADSGVEVYRQDSVAGSFAAAFIGVGMSGAFGFAAVRCLDQPLVMMLFAAPFMGFAAFITVVIAGILFQVARSSTRPTNWLMALAEDSLYLNLRAARNARADDEETTVLRFMAEEIESVGKVRETRREKHGSKQHTYTVQYIELHVPGCEPGEIEVPIEVERERESPSYRSVGIETRNTHHAAPAFTVEPNRIRIKWNSKLFDALGQRFDLAPQRDIDLTEQMAEMSPEEKVYALAVRGQRLHAAQLARVELGLKNKEAKDFVKAVLKDAA